jgi:hypothetical protein
VRHAKIMTAMASPTPHDHDGDAHPRAAPSAPAGLAPAAPGAARLALAGLIVAAALLVAGCGTGHPRPIASAELAEAQTFPFFEVYWVGPRFEGHALAAADGLRGYIERIGDSVYYGDCVQSKGIFGGGSCQLPLQVTTVVYRLHSNAPLGRQENTVIRGVPATIYDEGRSIELYTGRVAIDVFSDTPTHAMRATARLAPLNASGASLGPLPQPVYCPGLSGIVEGAVSRAMASLPGRACQRAEAATAYKDQVYG